MNPSVLFRLSLIFAIGFLVAMLLPAAVTAHDGRDIDQYDFVVGFSIEPAYEGIKNGVDLRVRIPATSEGEDPTPVEGVEETLQVEVTHVPSGQSRIFALRPVFNDPGHYTADLIPTAPGQYRFRFFGTVEGVEVDETFESGPGRFGDIESAAALQFPEPAASLREIESAVRGAQLTAEQAQDNASSVNTLALAGIVLGAIGTASGLGAILMMTRRPQTAGTVAESAD